MLNLIDVGKADLTKPKGKTADSVLRSVQTRIRNFVAWQYGEGQKISRSKPATLVVNRLIDGVNQRVLAIKIANETFAFASLDPDTEESGQCLEVASDLEEVKEELFNFSKWVDANVGKPATKRMPRPSSFKEDPTLH